MSFQSVTAATAVGPNTYAVNLSDDWCIGSVPNGGYVASVLLSVARVHASGTLSRLDQPNTMSMQLQYLRRTLAGPATVTVADVKLGGSVSVLHAVLSQDGRDRVQGYFTQTKFAAQEGITLPTSFISTGISPPPAPADLVLLERKGEDAHWRLEPEPPYLNFRKAMRNMVFYHPKQPVDPSVAEQWIRFRPGGKLAPFTNEALGFVVDMFPLIVDQFPQVEKKARWYPTVGLNLDIKRSLEPGGADWLYVRVRTGEIRNGRMDLQVVVLDAAGNLVALSSHITLVLSVERNLAGRQPGGQEATKEKGAGKL
ncbi:hypothetical protein GQ53DRAFT_702670 [Thozetella sp. PMI_491]|nr:hypothetical protein GQ53DRAFT_702670 [Thozetella sp. PMI_491]